MKIDIYTDASFAFDGTIKISSFIIDEQEDEYCFNHTVNKKHLHDRYKEFVPDDIQLYELYSIHEILCQFRKIPNLKITLYTDCLTCFQHLNGIGKVKPNKKLQSIIFNEIKKMKIDIEYRWIKGHVGVYGNIKADYLTRHKIKMKKGHNLVSEYIKKLHIQN